MSKKNRFRGPFDKQHGKCSQSLLKSASKNLYHINWSLPRQLIWKKSLWLTCEILGLLLNTLAADEKYPILGWNNLTIPIHMQLSQKQKSVSQFFATFLKRSWNLNVSKRKVTLRDFVFPKLRTLKTGLYKRLKSSASEDASRSNMRNVPKHCRNLHHSTFIRFIDHWQVNWVGKSLSYWHAKSWNFLLRSWLPMKTIMFLIETI